LNDEDNSARAASEPERLPSAEELRMVRAVAVNALFDAARHGDYSATFRGFRIQATRQASAPGTEALVEVSLCVTLGKHFVTCNVVTATDAGAMEPMPRGVVI